MNDILYMKRDDTPKSLFNPLSYSFKTKLRNDDNVEVEFEIPSMEIATFPAYQADRIKVDLMTAITNQRGLGLLTEEEKNKLQDEVEVNLHG